MGISDSRPEAGQRRSYYGWAILAIVFVTLFTAVSARGIVTLFIDTWRAQFGWSVAAITVALSIQLVVSGPAGIIAGRLTDRFGPKLPFVGFLALGIAGILGIAAMTELWQLYLFFGLFLGFGATLAPVTTPLIAKWFRKGRGLALGMVQEGDLLGLAALAPVMLSVSGKMTWRMSWLAMGVIVLVVVLPAAWILVRPSPADRPVSHGTGGKGAGVQGATFRAATRTRPFWMLTTANLFCGMTARFFWLLMAPIAMEGGMSTAQVGLTVTIAGLSALPGMVLFGAACERFSRATLLSVNFMVRSAAFVIMAFYLWRHEPGLMYAGAAMTGFLTRSSSPPFDIAMINCFGLRSLGTILGVTNTVHQVGGALSLLIAGYIFDRIGTYAPSLVAGAAMLVVAAVIAWRIPEKRCYSEVATTTTIQARQGLATRGD